MLRSFFSVLARAEWARRAITSWRVARRASSRFIAGESIEQAVQVVRRLNERGIQATLDHLGENTSSGEDAREAAEEVKRLLAEIQRAGLRCNVSIKLSQFGLGIDPSLCRRLLGEMLDCAGENENFLRIDMEDSSLTAATLETFEWALQQGYQDRVGIVLQSYLYRTQSDLEHVLGLGGRVRLCKGAYKEPVSVAYPTIREVNAAYDRLALRLLRHTAQTGASPASPNGRVPPLAALATHDPARIDKACRAASEAGLAKNTVEFQMLYGIRRDLQEQLAGAGYPVRVYVPYGTHWYPYFMRRLGERPANLWFFISNFFRR